MCRLSISSYVGCLSSKPGGGDPDCLPLWPAQLAAAVADFYDHDREAALAQGVAQEAEKYAWPTPSWPGYCRWPGAGNERMDL